MRLRSSIVNVVLHALNRDQFTCSLSFYVRMIFPLSCSVFSWAILLIVIAFHSCLYSLVAILIQESYVLSFAHVPTVGHGSAQFRPRVSSISATGQITSATGQLNRPRVSSNSATGQNTFGHGSAKWHCHGTICYWHGLTLCLRSIQKRRVLHMIGTKR